MHASKRDEILVNRKVPKFEIRIEFQDCVSHHSCYYSCKSARLGLLFERYVESRGLIWTRVKFSFNGIVLNENDYDHYVEDKFKCGVVNVVLVQIVPDRSETLVMIFERMNRLQKALHISRPGDAAPVYSDVVLKLLDYVGLEHMPAMCMVSVYWHITIQRFSLLSQLEMGLFFEPDQPYPFYLHSWVNEYTWQLAKSPNSTRDTWRKLRFSKHVVQYALSKGTMVKDYGTYVEVEGKLKTITLPKRG